MPAALAPKVKNRKPSAGPQLDAEVAEILSDALDPRNKSADTYNEDIVEAHTHAHRHINTHRRAAAHSSCCRLPRHRHRCCHCCRCCRHHRCCRRHHHRCCGCRHRCRHRYLARCAARARTATSARSPACRPSSACPRRTSRLRRRSAATWATRPSRASGGRRRSSTTPLSSPPTRTTTRCLLPAVSHAVATRDVEAPSGRTLRAASRSSPPTRPQVLANRSLALLSLKRGPEALQDAALCVTLKKNFAKGSRPRTLRPCASGASAGAVPCLAAPCCCG